MRCTIPDDVVERSIAFHGHSCPGLAIGLRAAEYAEKEFAEIGEGALVCVTETDMCGVDGIQFVTGCTFGKGNLIHRDYGKMAFSFFDRESGRGVRLLFSFDAQGTGREEMIEKVMSADLSELFTVQELATGPPRSARVMEGLKCSACGERTMESRTRRYAGETYCIPCFREVDQKR